jgi:hypothetical protein
MKPILALAMAAAVAGWGGGALACTCIQPSSASAHLEGADVVFRGVPVGSGAAREGELVTVFRVQEPLKGRTDRTVRVGHRLDSAACGVRFKPGASALVLARQHPDGRLRTSLCQTLFFSEAEYRRALVREVSRPPRRCDADAAGFAHGRRYTAALAADAQRAAGASELRVRRPGQAYTEDFRPDRLNLDLDRAGRIRGVVCG